MDGRIRIGPRGKRGFAVHGVNREALSDSGKGGVLHLRKLGCKGQNVVEFALVVTLLLWLVIGIAEFGRAWMTRNILTGAAREAVRIAVVRPPEGSEALGEARGRTVLDSAGLTVANIDVIDPGVSFGTVTAIASMTFQPALLGFVPGLSAGIPLASTTTMRREY